MARAGKLAVSTHEDFVQRQVRSPPDKYDDDDEEEFDEKDVKASLKLYAENEMQDQNRIPEVNVAQVTDAADPMDLDPPASGQPNDDDDTPAASESAASAEAPSETPAAASEAPADAPAPPTAAPAEG